MKVLWLKGFVSSPIDLDDEVWDHLIDRINDKLSSLVRDPVKISITELGIRKNRPSPQSSEKNPNDAFSGNANRTVL